MVTPPPYHLAIKDTGAHARKRLMEAAHGIGGGGSVESHAPPPVVGHRSVCPLDKMWALKREGKLVLF